MAKPWQYRWSSARALGAADPLLAENPDYLGLSDALARRQQLWRDFLLGDDPREEVVRRGDGAIGDDDFRCRVLVAEGRPAPRRRPRKSGADGRVITPQETLNS